MTKPLTEFLVYRVTSKDTSLLLNVFHSMAEAEAEAIGLSRVNPFGLYRIYVRQYNPMNFLISNKDK